MTIAYQPRRYRRPRGVRPAARTRRYNGAYVAAEKHLTVIGHGRPTRGQAPVIWCHGALDDALTGREANRYDDLRAIAWAGYPVIAADLAGQSWANTTAVGAGGRIDQAITWMASNLGTRIDRIILAGESMGTLLAMNWAWRNTNRVGALWLRAPLTNFEDFYNRLPLFQLGIELAHGGVPDWPLFDPLDNRPALAQLGHLTRIDAVTEDEFLLGVQVEEHARAVGAELHWRRGTHIQATQTPPAEVAAWVDATVNRRW